MEKKKFKNSKKIATQYGIKINGELAVVKSSRKEANTHLKTMKFDDSVQTIELVRQNITEYSIKVLKPVTTKVLVASDLTLDTDTN